MCLLLLPQSSVPPGLLSFPAMHRPHHPVSVRHLDSCSYLVSRKAHVLPILCLLSVFRARSPFMHTKFSQCPLNTILFPSGYPSGPMAPPWHKPASSAGLLLCFLMPFSSQGISSTIRRMELAASSMPSATSTVMLTASRVPAPPPHLQCPLPLHLCLPCLLAVIIPSLPGR